MANDKKVLVPASLLTSAAMLCLELDKYELDEKTEKLKNEVWSEIQIKSEADRKRRAYQKDLTARNAPY